MSQCPLCHMEMKTSYVIAIRDRKTWEGRLMIVSKKVYDIIMGAARDSEIFLDGPPSDFVIVVDFEGTNGKYSNA